MKDKRIHLLKRFKDDDKALLEEHPSLENLYTFSAQGLALVEGLSYAGTEKVLYVGEINIPRISYILKRVLALYYCGKSRDVYFLKTSALVEQGSLICSKSLTALSGLRFDKIFLFGALDASFQRQLREYRSLLQAGGKLIIAADNVYGIKALQGAAEGGFALSYEELHKACEALGFAQYREYFPFPDYHVPLTLYSAEYLPEEEDLRDDIAAYRYPKYAMQAPGELYAGVCARGDFKRFSNSFFFILGERTPEIFVKYNRNRRDAFAIKTAVIQEQERRFVRKSPLFDAGREHIRRMGDSYERLQAENKELSYVKPQMQEGAEWVDFAYIKGQTLTRFLSSKIRKGVFPQQDIQAALDTVIGEGSINIDASFDNFILHEGRLIGIDYEWVAKEVPEKKYSHYRALKAFYAKNAGRLRASKEEFLAAFNISAEDTERFEHLERYFQEEVHGDNQRPYLDNYFVEFKDEQALARMEKEHTHLAGISARLEHELRDKSLAFDRLLEMKRLSDNHIANLDALIANLREQNTAQAHTLAHLNRHISLPYRIYRKIKTKFDAKFPPGSKGRKKFSYAKLLCTRPLYMWKLLSSKEGRNRLKGDMLIGADYLERGKLCFSYTEQPKVSIVIPVYNQVHYTYACLQSILEHSKGIDYEVIIADDVSTDATARLQEFTENLVIIRNASNQGFLKNCNHAAKSARGEYIVFLNNDTRVTEGWLDSLLDLIESDESIGMVGSKLVYPDGRLQEAGGIIWSDGSGWNYGRFDDPSKCAYNYVREVDYISGAAIMLSSKLWRSIGGFDERFAPAYCEDSDLAFTVRKRGLRVLYQPKSVVIHDEGISNGTDVHGSGLKRYQLENSEKLKQKWKKELRRQYKNDAFPNVFRARERSGGKKIILFVDHYVPTFDKDAGSKTTYQYVKLLLAKGYVVKFLGDNFLREEPYTTALEQLGIEVLYGNDMRAGIFDWIKEHEKDIHLVYLNRPHIAGNYIDFIKEHTSLKVIYYGHDLHFLREQREYALSGKQEQRDNSKYWKSIEMSIMRKADMSYYPSQVEVDYIRELDENIQVKAITAYVYEQFKEDTERDFGKREGILFVGGFAHPPNTDAILWFVKEVWPLLKPEGRPQVYIAGSQAGDEVKALHDEEKGLIYKGFVTEEELEALYRQVRLVIVPLRYGAGVKGKLIEALYYHVPVLTSSVGAEGILHAEEALCVRDKAEDFAKELEALYADVTRLQKMSRAAESYIREHNSVEAVWKIIKEDFV